MRQQIPVAKPESTAERSKPLAGGKRTEPQRAFVPPPESVTLTLHGVLDFRGFAAEIEGDGFWPPISGGGVRLASGSSNLPPANGCDAFGINLAMTISRLRNRNSFPWHTLNSDSSTLTCAHFQGDRLRLISRRDRPSWSELLDYFDNRQSDLARSEGQGIVHLVLGEGVGCG
ncbi:MAG: hypothetical protein AAF802_18390 [Planctomycetota bacterium]